MAEIAHVQTPVTDYARSKGWLARRMSYLGRRGCPDSWYFKHGRVIIIEFKDPLGELSEIQKRQIAKLRKAGMEVHVIDSAVDGYALFN